MRFVGREDIELQGPTVAGASAVWQIGDGGGDGNGERGRLVRFGLLFGVGIIPCGLWHRCMSTMKRRI